MLMNTAADSRKPVWLEHGIGVRLLSYLSATWCGCVLFAGGVLWVTFLSLVQTYLHLHTTTNALELTVAIMGQSRRDVAEEHVDVAAQHVIDDEIFASIRDVDHADSRQGHEHAAGEVRGRSVALRPIGDLVRILLRQGDQLGVGAAGVEPRVSIGEVAPEGPAPELVTRPPDVQDTAASLSSGETLVSRPPDVSDTAQALQSRSSVNQSSGFDWNRWGIGIGAGMGVALLLGIAFVMGRQHRHRVQPA